MADERCRSCGHPVADHGNENPHGTSPGCLLNCRCSLSKDQAVDWRARCLRAEQERDKARQHLFNIAVAVIRDPRVPVDGQAAVSAVVDVAANRQWLLDEHVPQLTAAIADRDQQIAALRETVDRMRPVVDVACRLRSEMKMSALYPWARAWELVKLIDGYHSSAPVLHPMAEDGSGPTCGQVAGRDYDWRCDTCGHQYACEACGAELDRAAIEEEVVEKVAEWIWRESQGDRTVIHDAGIMQRIADRLRSGAWRNP